MKNDYLKWKLKEEIDDYRDLFISEDNYYYSAWINGNKNHVITHLRIFSDDPIFYNSIISQFAHKKDLLLYLLNEVKNQHGTFINKTYL